VSLLLLRKNRNTLIACTSFTLRSKAALFQQACPAQIPKESGALGSSDSLISVRIPTRRARSSSGYGRRRFTSASFSLRSKAALIQQACPAQIPKESGA
jgi:hypothetical protein